MYDFDVRGLIWLAYVGAVAILIGLVVGVPLLVWTLIHHLAINWR